MSAEIGRCSHRLTTSGAVADCKRLPSWLGCSGCFCLGCPAPEPTRQQKGRLLMGEAIARFREMALAMRQAADAAFMQTPQAVFCGMLPTEGFRIESGLRSGDMQPREFASLLRSAVRDGRNWKDKDAPTLHAKDRRDWTLSLGGKRERILARAPQKTDLDKQHAASLREIADCGNRLLFASIERRLAALSESTLAMRTVAADAYVCRHSRGKLTYAKQLMRWQKAFDALAPFVDEPPAAAGSSPKKKTGGTKQEKRRDRKGVGGRPERYALKFIREVVAARERDQKHAAKGTRRLPAFPQWLREYCTGKGIDIRERFLPANPGETWSVTAKRFWRAAKKRVRESGN